MLQGNKNLDSREGLLYASGSLFAGVAQLVEQLICNQQVRGSSPFASSSGKGAQFKLIAGNGEVPERSKGADCKSVGNGLRWFESTPRHQA